MLRKKGAFGDLCDVRKECSSVTVRIAITPDKYVYPLGILTIPLPNHKFDELKSIPFFAKASRLHNFLFTYHHLATSAYSPH